VVDGGETDTVVGFHRARGTAYHDTFVGTSGDDSYTSYTDYAVDPHEKDGDIVETGDGDDDVSAFGGEIDLGPGDDRGKVVRGAIQGGTGDDQVAVVMDGTARGGPGDDVVAGWVDAEELGHGYADDRLELIGGPGRDEFTQPGVSAQADNHCPGFCAHADIGGGSGRDTFKIGSYRGVVDLEAGRARTKNARSELSSIEHVVGGPRSDVIRGDGGRNHLDGGRGDDVLVGRGGDDILHGGQGHDRADGGRLLDRCEAEVELSC
jgi:Ca2+-binding RTX toxin-like protein